MRKIFVTLLFLTFTSGLTIAQDIVPRIAGLGDNKTYMSLLREDAQLRHKEDSLVNHLSELRAMFRKEHESFNPDTLLALEGEIFDVKNRRGDVTVQINIIEQEWVLNNYSTQSQKEERQETNHSHNRGTAIAASNNRNLIDNLCFTHSLSDEDYATLQLAQRNEGIATKLAEQYKVLYDTMVNLHAEYAMATTIEQGAPLFERYGEVEQTSLNLADSLSNVWTHSFDNKTYSYAYMLESISREDLIDYGAEATMNWNSEATTMHGEYISDALVDYCCQRRAMLEYEIAIAEHMGLRAATDSLRMVLANEKSFEFRLPKIDMQERLFLDYAHVDFASPAIYSAQNPIPECKVYERGTIYRILLGTFWSKQAVSLFKGAYPLGFLKMNGKHSYFAGGYATKAEADEAVATLKKRGFKNPVVVRWRDGEYRNLDSDPESEPQRLYRVEIEVASLTDAIREAVAANSDGAEITRINDGVFVVGGFTTSAQAQKLVDALHGINSNMDVKIEEIIAQ